jgi:serine/threonine-protein kinase
MPVGEVVAGRYEVAEQIGAGGQALVYRAIDRHKGQPVALKMLPGNAQEDPSAVERMVREQQAMVTLAGTSAVGFVDLCHSDSGAVCLVMELLEGEDLEARLEALENRSEHMPLAEVLRILSPIVDTLDKAHAVGIVHRDLKPANIFLARPDDRPRLLDFGFSRMKSSNQVTALGQVMGSPSYIAPEMWLGSAAAADHRADVYSFGVIVFRMLAGCLPFEGGDLREKLAQATTAARPSLHALRSDLPVAVDEWVEQSLAIDRERRESVRASFDALHLALGLPLEKREHDAESSSKIRRVRRWLASPLGGLQGSMAAAFRAATGVFERLKRSTTSMLPALPANGGARVAEDSIAIAERETVLDGRARASTSGSIRSGVSALPPPPPRVRGAQKSEPESCFVV